ncbi:flagellar hook protein FlgE [Planctomycetales bacterium]|nr:flagellar hook protein FlgE [Planctomycetales bacterium]
MGLGLESAIHTASTGMKASEKTINVSGNNLSNANTIGYKAERADFADFISYTYRLGTTPGTGFSEGTNPTQIGMGVVLAGTTTDFAQGSFKEGMTNTDVAINGNGFLILQNGTDTRQYYSRNGVLKVNQNFDLVSNTGYYVMGYRVDDKFQVQTDKLTNLKIPVGEMHIAEETQNITIEGILNAVGDSGTQGTVLRTPPMTDLSKSAPATDQPATITQLSRPIIEGATQAVSGSAGGNIEPGDYLYRFVYVDTNGVESDFSAPINASVGAGQNSVTINNLPNVPAEYASLRIYRAVDSSDPTKTAEFYQVADIPAASGNTYTDIVSTASITNPAKKLDQSRLGESYQYSYQYYITYTDALGNESLPVKIGDPYNINNGQLVLSNLPTVDPANNPDGWTGRKIYRNTGSDPTDIHLVGEIDNMDPAATLIDRVADSSLIENPAVSEAGRGNVLINQNTKLVDVGKFVNGKFSQVFEEGTLTLTPQKGTTELRAATLEITPNTTVADYLAFLNEAYGIRNSNDGVPPDQGAIGKTINNGSQGAAVIDGSFYILGNAGESNALVIDANDMQLATGKANDPRLIDLGWGQDPNNKQNTVGSSASTDLQVFDSLGTPVNVRLTFVLESKSNTETAYRWYADSGDNQPIDGSAIATGTGTIRFDQNGRLISASNTTISVERTQVASTSPLDFQFEMHVDALMALATNEPSVMQTSQDGAGAGTLYDFTIQPDGVIMGRFTSGAERPLGQIPLATFRNQEGLYKAGDSLFLAGTNSGDAKINIAGTGGIGVFKSNALELSNSDIGTEIVNMILASAMYRANAKVMTTSNEMYDALLRIV